MNVRERIAKLEAILARVGERAAAPRATATNGAVSAAAPAVFPEPARAPTAVPEVAHAAARERPDDPVVSFDETPIDIEMGELTEEAPPVFERAPAGEAPEEAPISAETAVPVAAAQRAPSAHPVPDFADAPEISVQELPAPESIEEEPPASSRRPIALEPKLEELAFGESPTPEGSPHAPPPESGRQVAASPVDLDFEGEFTGIRPKEPEPAAVTVVAEAARPLTPETTKPVLPGASLVAFHGAPPAIAPTTFGELLDSSLAL